MGTVDIVFGELEAVAEGVVHMGLCSEVHDGIDMFSDKQVVDQICTPHVSFHELEIIILGIRRLVLQAAEGRSQIVQI